MTFYLKYITELQLMYFWLTSYFQNFFVPVIILSCVKKNSTVVMKKFTMSTRLEHHKSGFYWKKKKKNWILFIIDYLLSVSKRLLQPTNFIVDCQRVDSHVNSCELSSGSRCSHFFIFFFFLSKDFCLSKKFLTINLFIIEIV